MCTIRLQQQPAQVGEAVGGVLVEPSFGQLVVEERVSVAKA